MNRSFAKPIQSLQPGRNTTAQSLLLQRQCACGAAGQVSSQCAECREKELVQRKSGNGRSPVSEAPPSVHEVLRSSGQTLDQATRAFFEPRFGHDFSKVRVHADGEASRSATAVNALAYTVGEHIVFRAGRYDPLSMEGRRLLAHELTHVLQQGVIRHRATTGRPVESATKVEGEPFAQTRLEIGEPDDRFEREADRIADRIVSGATASVAAPSSESPVDVTAGLTPAAVVRPRLQRQPQAQTPAAGTCPNDVAFSTGNTDVHVPLCGISNVTASTVPASIPGIVWSLAASTAQIASGTAIGSSNGQITFAAAQTGGRVNVTATQPTSTVGGPCTASAELILNSHPSAISSTFVVGPLASTRTEYGAVFDHNFSSADGRVASLENVPVGEEFSGVPNPTATIHRISTPFGDFDLATRNLPATPSATTNWFVTGGSLGGNHDSVSIDRSLPKVGEFLPSASNPTPANTLPVGFTVTQGLFWFCRQAAAGSAWTKIRDVDHVRTLRLDSTGTGVEFVVSVNGEENAEPYTGQPAIINASASPATIPPTPARPRRGPAPTPSTTTISADPRPDPMPSGHALRFSIQGAALGCTVNSTTGLFTAGTATGTVTVRIRDSARANTNFDEVVVTIANPTPPTPAPPQPQPGQPQPGPGQPGPGQPGPGPGQPNPNPSPVPKTSSSTESNEES